MLIAAAAPDTPHQRIMAAVLAGPEGTLASHRAAAWLWGLIDLPEVEIVVDRRHRVRLEGGVVHHPLDWHRARRSFRAGIPVTNPLRTLVDLGAVLPEDEVAAAVERALIARLVTFRGLCREWRRVAKPGRSGSGVLRRILDNRLLGEVPPDSVLEVRAAPIFRRVGLGLPSFQYEVEVGRARPVRVDFAYLALRIAIEFDGWEVHGSPSAMRRDLHRQNALVAAGWMVLRFTWADVVERPDWVASEIRRAATLRAAA